MSDFAQVGWDELTEDSCRHIVRLAIREDLDRGHDWTTLALVPEGVQGSAALVSRSGGVVSGLLACSTVIDEAESPIQWESSVEEGSKIAPGVEIARLTGPARYLLTLERILLNLVSRLSGIATLTSQYCAAVAGLPVGIYDTRKTTPGWRRLEKYAVRCGGGRNHRAGLFDAILIKDNHLCLAADFSPSAAAEAVATARRFREAAELNDSQGQPMLVEVEVDTLDQLRSVLPQGPDIVLLDNMTTAQLCDAVSLRNELGRGVQLEASGGITLKTVRGVAETGVDRISVGALTHAAVSIDIGMDWDVPAERR